MRTKQQQQEQKKIIKMYLLMNILGSFYLRDIHWAPPSMFYVHAISLLLRSFHDNNSSIAFFSLLFLCGIYLFFRSHFRIHPETEGMHDLDIIIQYFRQNGSFSEKKRQHQLIELLWKEKKNNARTNIKSKCHCESQQQWDNQNAAKAW